MNKKLDPIIEKTVETISLYELSLNYARYEYLRKLNPRQFHDLWVESFKDDNNFDDLVDKMILTSLNK